MNLRNTMTKAMKVTTNVRNFIPRTLCAALAAAVAVGAAGLARGEQATIFVGTYTRGTDSEGIYSFRFDDATGALTPLGVTGDVENPSFLALHPSGQLLYSSDEINDFDGGATGTVSAFAIDANAGELKLLNREPVGGTSPCHLSVDATGGSVLAVGYGSGTVTELPLTGDGRLQPARTVLTHAGSSVNKDRQTSPHPHQIVLSPDNRFALVPDLGTDKIVQYKFDPASGLAANAPTHVATAAGAGPRHVAFHPSGRTVYAINELDLTVDQYDYDADRGTLACRATVPLLPADADRTGASGAEIAVHPNGRTLYASVRGPDEIVAFRIDGSSGALTPLQRVSTGGKTPRFFGLDPSGRWLLACNQNSGTIVVFRAGNDGRLEPTAHKVNVPAPVCVVFVPR